MRQIVAVLAPHPAAESYFMRFYHHRPALAANDVRLGYLTRHPLRKVSRVY